MSPSLVPVWRVALGAIAATATWAVHAQSSGGPALTGNSVGLARMAAPVYAGSDEYRARVLFGAKVTADPGRRQRDAEALRGMGNIETRLELGVFVQVPFGERAMVSSSLIAW